MTLLRCECHLARSAECLREPREYHEVGVNLDALQSAHPERRESVVVFQPSDRHWERDYA